MRKILLAFPVLLVVGLVLSKTVFRDYFMDSIFQKQSQSSNNVKGDHHDHEHDDNHKDEEVSQEVSKYGQEYKGENIVTIARSLFTPQNITIPKGSRVVWRNLDNKKYTLVFNNDSTLKIIANPKQEAGVTFEEGGIFNYKSEEETGIKGKIEVK